MNARHRMLFRTSLLVTVVALSMLVFGHRALAAEQPAPADEPELIVDVEGIAHILRDGVLYRVDADTGDLTFVVRVYDPGSFEENYAEEEGRIYRKDPAGGPLIPVRRRFEEGFEDAEVIGDRVGLERGWTTFTLQSPSAPTVEDYVALRHQILEGTGDFRENRLGLTSDVVHTGAGALEAYAVRRSPQMVTSKASLSTELLHFARGDDVWFSGWFFLAEGTPTTLMDLESTWLKGHPGMRILLDDGGHAALELKWLTKPVYRQMPAVRRPVPKGQWVHLKAHCRVSELDDGIAELWQDGTKIIEARGQTLPLAHTIYNNLEIGISANSFPSAARLYVDDISISDEPLD